MADLSGPRVVLATRNAHKVAELSRILAAVGFADRLTGLDAFPGAPDVPETGLTFADNALLKARAIAAYTGLPAVADDSGLCVDALHGMPGVFSARWSGSHGDDRANLALVLGQLTDVAERGAQFVCVAALVLPPVSETPDGTRREWTTTGVLTGELTRAPRGTNGFGYDPIFVPGGMSVTTAQLAPEEKDAISHRGRAFRALAELIPAHVHLARYHRGRPAAPGRPTLPATPFPAAPPSRPRLSRLPRPFSATTGFPGCHAPPDAPAPLGAVFSVPPASPVGFVDAVTTLLSFETIKCGRHVNKVTGSQQRQVSPGLGVCTSRGIRGWRDDAARGQPYRVPACGPEAVAWAVRPAR